MPEISSRIEEKIGKTIWWNVYVSIVTFWSAM